MDENMAGYFPSHLADRASCEPLTDVEKVRGRTGQVSPEKSEVDPKLPPFLLSGRREEYRL